MKIYLGLLIFIIPPIVLFANVNSTIGTINFEVNNSTVMTLNTAGLGVGVTPTEKLQISGNSIISESLAIGTGLASSNLQVNGSIGYGFLTIADNCNLNNISSQSMIFADTSAGNIFVHLPYAANVTGRIYQIKKTSLNNELRIVGGGNYIDNDTVINLSRSISGLNPAMSVMSSNGQWYIISSDTNGQIASANLISWWKIDEGSGNVIFDAISRRNGILTGLDGDEWVPGRISYGLYLNASGTNDYGNIADDDMFDFDQTQSFSISAWIKISRKLTGTSTKIIAKRVADRWYELQLYQGFKPELAVLSDVGAEKRATSASNVMDGQWHHLVGCVDRTTRISSIYIDGYVKGSATNISGNITSTSSLKFGVNGTENFPGIIDDVRIYNKALTSLEIEALYGQGL